MTALYQIPFENKLKDNYECLPGSEASVVSGYSTAFSFVSGTVVLKRESLLGPMVEEQWGMGSKFPHSNSAADSQRGILFVLWLICSSGFPPLSRLGSVSA
jgi:hypothetical protein